MVVEARTELFLVQTRLKVQENPQKLDMSGYGVAIPALAAYERSKGIKTKVYDPNLGMDTYEQILDKIVNENPLVLGISRITAVYFDGVYKFIKDIRERGYEGFLFLGGHAPTVECDRILQQGEGLDCIVMGEGEVTIFELVTAIRENREWKSIDGLAYFEDGKIIKNKLRPLIQNLDELPFMATDYLEELQSMYGKDITAYLVSSRGCYMNCSFCSIAAYFDMFEGCRMRYRSVKNVFAEVKSLYENYGIRKFCFWDDNFIIPGKKGEERVRELTELIKTLPEKISIELETRVDTISFEVIKMLKEAGLKHIHLGIEGFTDRDLKLYNKGVTLEQNIKALNTLEELGFSTKVGSKYRIATYLICFNPFTQLEDIKNMLYYFDNYNISPKKQITSLQVMNRAPIKKYLLDHGIVLKGETNEWDFLDERVGDIFAKYSEFIDFAMQKREQLRTIEKRGIIKDMDILEDITQLRKKIDDKCTRCLEVLTNAYLENNDSEKVEIIYQGYIEGFIRFIDDNISDNIKYLIDKYGRVFYQENL